MLQKKAKKYLGALTKWLLLIQALAFISIAHAAKSNPVYQAKTDFQGMAQIDPGSKDFMSHFKSDSAECTQTLNGNIDCIYSGNAFFEQKGDRLIAAKIVISKDKKGKITLAIAEGGNGGIAKYNKGKTASSDDKTDTMTKAEANVIKFYPDKNLLILTGKAKITTEKQNKITGSYIEYNIKQKTVFAKPISNERTTLILHPRNAHE